MRRYIIILALLAISATSCTRHNTFHSQQATLRIMSYNVHNAIGMDKVTSCERIAGVISDANVELVALQELDSVTHRSNGADILKNIAEHCQMHHTFCASIDFQGGKYGIGVLSKEKPLSHFKVALPCRSEPRSLLVVEFKEYYFCSTHLSLHAEDRLSSAKIIVDELSKLQKPVIFGGDFNASPEEESMQYLAKHLNIYTKGESPFANNPSPYTYPADKPKIEIDYIGSYSPNHEVKVLSHYTKFHPVESDHAPIIAEIEIK